MHAKRRGWHRRAVAPLFGSTWDFYLSISVALRKRCVMNAVRLPPGLAARQRMSLLRLRGLDCERWHDLADELFVAKYLDATDEEREGQPRHDDNVARPRSTRCRLLFRVQHELRRHHLRSLSSCRVRVTGPTSALWTAPSTPMLARSPASDTLVEKAPFSVPPQSKKANVSWHFVSLRALVEEIKTVPRIA
jgi:hypothetical protein